MTVVMVSHDVEFCAENADIAAMFFDGQIIASGTPPGILWLQQLLYHGLQPHEPLHF